MNKRKWKPAVKLLKQDVEHVRSWLVASLTRNGHHEKLLKQDVEHVRSWLVASLTRNGHHEKLLKQDVEHVRSWLVASLTRNGHHEKLLKQDVEHVRSWLVASLTRNGHHEKYCALGSVVDEVVSTILILICRTVLTRFQIIQMWHHLTCILFCSFIIFESRLTIYDWQYQIFCSCVTCQFCQLRGWTVPGYQIICTDKSQTLQMVLHF